jgi:hypothetical protein
MSVVEAMNGRDPETVRFPFLDPERTSATTQVFSQWSGSIIFRMPSLQLNCDGLILAGGHEATHIHHTHRRRGSIAIYRASAAARKNEAPRHSSSDDQG